MLSSKKWMTYNAQTADRARRYNRAERAQTMKVKIGKGKIGTALFIGKWERTISSPAEAARIIIHQNYNGTRVSIVSTAEVYDELTKKIKEFFK